MSLSANVCISVCLLAFMPVYIYLSICLSVHNSIFHYECMKCISDCLTVLMSSYVYINISLYVSRTICICLSVRLFVCLSVHGYLPVCLSTFVSVCLSAYDCPSLRAGLCGVPSMLSLDDENHQRVTTKPLPTTTHH